MALGADSLSAFVRAALAAILLALATLAWLLAEAFAKSKRANEDLMAVSGAGLALLAYTSFHADLFHRLVLIILADYFGLWLLVGMFGWKRTQLVRRDVNVKIA